jgi:hypothetical protein
VLCLNELWLISLILPILFLLSLLSQSTWIDFRNFADSDLAQRFAPRTFIEVWY